MVATLGSNTPLFLEIFLEETPGPYSKFFLEETTGPLLLYLYMENCFGRDRRASYPPQHWKFIMDQPPGPPSPNFLIAKCFLE